MKKSISLIIITLFLIIFSFALPSGIQAAEFHFKSYTLTQEETVKDDIYAFGDSVKIDGVIDGDLIVIASNVQLNGTVTGDAYLFGTTVNINGNVIGTTTIFANNTSVQGVLSENVSIVSTYITFNAQTSKDVFALSAENTFQGSIGDDLRAYSIKSNIDSTVSGDLLLLGNDYTVSEEKISRNIYYNSTLNTIARDQGVDVENGVKIKMPVVLDKSIENNWSFISLKALVGFVSFALIGLILITLTPVKSAEISSKITGSPDEFLKSLIMSFAIITYAPTTHIPINLDFAFVFWFPRLDFSFASYS